MAADSFYEIFVALSRQTDRRSNLLGVVYEELNPKANERPQIENERDEWISNTLTDLAYQGEFLAAFIVYATKRLCEILLDCIVHDNRPYNLVPSDAACAINAVFGVPQSIDTVTIEGFLLLHRRSLLAAGITFDEDTLQFTDERFAVLTQSLDFLFNPVMRESTNRLINGLSAAQRPD